MLDLVEIACPNCLAPIDLTNHSNNTITCEACSSNFLLEGHLCPKCNAYYKTEVDNCGACGTAMMRTCGKCKTSNWAGDEYCKACGVALDLIDMTIKGFHEQSQRHQAERMEQIREVRAKEKEVSEKRMAEFERAEIERQAEIRRNAVAQQKRDKRNLILTGVLILGVFMVFVGLLLSFQG